jgi:hypothetical protein
VIDMIIYRTRTSLAANLGGRGSCLGRLIATLRSRTARRWTLLLAMTEDVEEMLGEIFRGLFDDGGRGGGGMVDEKLFWWMGGGLVKRDLGA